MFDLVKSHKVVIGVILFLVSIPFAFFGIDFYFRGGDGAGQVAEVGNAPVSFAEFERALQQRQQQLRQAMQGRADVADLVNSPQVREAVLNEVVDDRLMHVAAAKNGMVVTNAELAQIIANFPMFKEGGGTGGFSRQLYEAALRAQGLSEQGFEAMLRRDVLLNRTRNALNGSAFIPAAVLDRLYRVRGQEREISELVFAPEQFVSKVEVDAAAVQAYYDANKATFRVPEKVKVEYVLLSLERVQRQVQVTPEQIQEYYAQNRAQFEAAEERRARHILLSVPADATPEKKAEIRARAETLLAEAKAGPAGRFAELARKHSEDPGSAAEGGDLGRFPRGRMVKPFDDAVFAAQVGEVVGPVETQYGFHIIRVEEIVAGSGTALEAATPQIEAELRKAEAGRRFAEAAEAFSNLVYEQPDSLEPAVKEFGLEVQTSDWISREGGAPDDPLLNNQKFLAAVFGEGVVKDRINTEAIEIAPNVLVAARVLEYAPAQDRPLDEVRASIQRQLTRERAVELAREAGQARLAKLNAGNGGAPGWSAAYRVSRAQRGGLAPEAAQAVFSADVAKLPAYAGAQVGERYVVYRISRVTDVEQVDAEQRKALASEIGQAAALESQTATLDSLRGRIGVKVNQKAIQPNG